MNKGEIMRIKAIFFEALILFLSIIKWSLYSAVIGVTAGLGVFVFLTALNLSIQFMQSNSNYYFSLPIAFLLSTFIIKNLAKSSGGHGTDAVIEAVHRDYGRLDIKSIPAKLLAVIVTISGGGSLGKEGPSVLIGAGIASGISDFLRLKDIDRKKAALCGISAGVAAVFGTPLAGAMFATEILYMGKISYEAIFSSIVSAFISFSICKNLGIKYFRPDAIIVPSMNPALFTHLIISGIFFGLVALLFVETINSSETITKKIKIKPYTRSIIGGLALIMLAKLTSTAYLGLGMNTIEGLIDGEKISHLGFLYKILFTFLTLISGGNGGVLVPIFFTGAAAGFTYASLWNMPISMFAAAGLAGVFSGAVNVPLTAALYAIETFGVQAGSYIALVCTVSYIVSGHRSINSSQILGVPKSPGIEVPIMKNFNDVDVKDFKDNTWGIMGTIVRKCEKIFHND